MPLVCLLPRTKSAVARPCFLKHKTEDKILPTPQYRQAVTEVLVFGENPMSFCAPEIQNGQAWDWTPTSTVTDRQEIAIWTTFYLISILLLYTLTTGELQYDMTQIIAGFYLSQHEYSVSHIATLCSVCTWAAIFVCQSHTFLLVMTSSTYSL
jgi:hypothetical protein